MLKNYLENSTVLTKIQLRIMTLIKTQFGILSLAKKIKPQTNPKYKL